MLQRVGVWNGLRGLAAFIFILIIALPAHDYATGLGDVHVHLNGGADVAYIGQNNTVEFWILNDDPLEALTIGFEFTIGTSYSFSPTYGAFGYVNPEGDAVGAFNVLHTANSSINDVSTDSVEIVGMDTAPTEFLPIHNVPTLCYSMQFFIPGDQPETTGGFCVDNILFSFSSTWSFNDGTPYPPDFMGNPNTSIGSPDAPPVCFDIVNPPTTEPPVILNCPDTLFSSHCAPATYGFEAADPDGGWDFSWSTSKGTINESSGLFSLDYSGVPFENVFLTVADDEGEVTSCPITVVFDNKPPTLVGPCDQSFVAIPEVPFSAQFLATDPDPCDSLSFFIDAVIPTPAGPINIDPNTGMLEFTPAPADDGTDFQVDVGVTDQIDIEICQMSLSAGTEPITVCGDANSDGLVNITDAVFLISYIFAGGDPPIPVQIGDADCSGIPNITDAVYIIVYVFAEGPPPGDPDNDGVPECLCDVNPCNIEVTGPCCMCESCDGSFQALATPPGGELKWEITSGGDKAAISGSDSASTVQVCGTGTSGGTGDVTIRARYIVDGDTCYAEAQFTVLHFDLSFRSSGTYSPGNDVVLNIFKYFGGPQLGPVEPGSPDSCRVYGKGVEIKAMITPCDADLPDCVGSLADCVPDIKRLRRGRVGTKTPAGAFVPGGAADSPNAWVDDDPDDSDEDLDPSLGDCAIYAVDAPGYPPLPCQPGDVGRVYVNAQNFKEWVEVNGHVCSDTLYWHASTVYKCNGSTLVPDSLCYMGDCIRNEVGPGHVVFPDIDSVSKIAAWPGDDAQLGERPEVNVQFLVEEIGSDNPARRISAYGLAFDLVRSGKLSDSELTELRDGLKPIAEADNAQSPLGVSFSLAGRIISLIARKQLAP